MKVVCLTGMSGSGKSTIAKEICKDDRYNLIYSFTDRLKRDEDDCDHTFVDNNHMDTIFENDDVVAKAEIDGYRYCSIKSQFEEDKINIYICDVNGINGVKKNLPMAEMMTILIRRKEIYIDCVRLGRDVCIPAREDVDFLINNDGKVEAAASTIKLLINLDLFSKAAEKVKTIDEKLKYIDTQYRQLNTIRASLYEQLWYLLHSEYVNLCEYVQHEINKEFDFEITIEPDHEPEIHEEYLRFNVIGDYKVDLYWHDMDKIVELISHYAYKYCEDNNLKELMFRLNVAEKYSGDEFDI